MTNSWLAELSKMLEWLVLVALAAEVWHLHRFRRRCKDLLHQLPVSPLSPEYVAAVRTTGELARWKDTSFRFMVTEENTILSTSPRLLVTYKPLLVQTTRLLSVRARWWWYRKPRGHGEWTSTPVPTSDGEYRIWSRVVAHTRPLVFFPGFGMGVVAYVPYLSQLNRTTHAIEVPNLSNLTWEQTVSIPTRHTLLAAFHTIVPEQAVVVDIMGHSMGTLAASMLANGLPARRMGAMVLFDPFCHPVALLDSTRLVFATRTDTSSVRTALAQHFVSRDLEVQAFARFSRLEDITLWRTDGHYPPILNMWSADDLFLDHTRFRVDGQTHHVVPGKHGSSMGQRHMPLVATFFARERESTAATLLSTLD
jgi:pimeloyl-ACP methyl ester carboxylesterase